MKEPRKSFVKSLFNLDSKWLRYSESVFDFMTLNLLFCLSCLPILSIGIAKLALYASLAQRRNKQSNSLLRDYLSYFRKYRTIGFQMGLIELSLLAAIFTDLYLVWALSSFPYQVFKAFCWGSLFLVILTFAYAYPQVTKGQSKLSLIFKRSFILLSLHFPWSFAFLAVILLLFILLEQSPLLFLTGLSLLLIIGVSSLGYGYVCIMEKLLK
ncbi:YesL family protein [Streptococcus catagoni]|uniref:YesL family protein n=1 Tax=Streptococcus catagoni TaxID=2654874 RepID=UPI00140B5E1C|nr:YesL family protein [Streptococcus catagoni]